jgi:hypothetical protein
MTSAYKDDVVYAKRGMMLGNYRSSFLLQDEVKFKAPSNLYWFMHTEGVMTLLGFREKTFKTTISVVVRVLFFRCKFVWFELDK